MDKDRRDLINRLFAEAMTLLEDATVIPTAGQSSSIAATAYVNHARQLQGLAGDLAAMARVAEMLGQPTSNRLRRTRRRNPTHQRTGLPGHSKRA